MDYTEHTVSSSYGFFFNGYYKQLHFTSTVLLAMPPFLLHILTALLTIAVRRDLLFLRSFSRILPCHLKSLFIGLGAV